MTRITVKSSEQAHAPLSLAHRVACVTGGTRGIGAAICEALASRGAAVVTCGPTDESVRLCNERAQRSCQPIVAVRADAASEQGVNHLVQAALERFGRLDVLVAAIGRPFKGSAMQTSLQDWDECQSINVRAPFIAARAVLPHLKASDMGSIVFVASIWAVTATYERVAYTVAKSGVVALARALAVDHARDGIRVNAVAPGYVDTVVLRSSLAEASPDGDIDSLLDEARRRHPLGRIASPEEIAAAVAFLAGPESSFVTGQVLVVDGGATGRFGLADMWAR
jgi:NAD(P)-dependent dehydrogenase (short-subunit alcohol dehydrogenase family)